MPLTKKSAGGARIVVGLNSGTSADGVDMAALRVRGDNEKVEITFLSGRNNRYPKELRTAILKTINTKSITPEQLIALDNIVGKFFGTCARRFIREINKKGIKVDAVGSHGQTIRHLPIPIQTGAGSAHGSLQIASPEQIAFLTDLPVVSDFRQADIALGGEGAPITVAAMHQLYSHAEQPRLIVNIGGLANYFYFPAGSKMTDSQAADCGPGNSLIDSLTQILFDLPFDHSGHFASQGSVSRDLLKRLKRAPFFSKGKRVMRKSTGKEEFGLAFARRIISAGKQSRIDPHNLLATVTELTVWGILRSIKPALTKSGEIRKLYLTGGGVRNNLIRRRLENELPEITVCSIDELGIPASLVEAAAFAVMADVALRGVAFPTRFGTKKAQQVMPVSGRISLPPMKENKTGTRQWRYCV